MNVHNFLHEYAEFLSDYGYGAEFEFIRDWERSPVLAEYIARNNYFSRDDMIRNIVKSALFKDTIYKAPYTLSNMLKENSGGQHSITVTLSPYEDIHHEVQIEAYHISAHEWFLIGKAIKEEIVKEEDENYEDTIYTTRLFKEPKDIEFNYCIPNDYISSTTTIHGNCLNDDCDTYGTIYNTRAQSAFVFYIVDQKEYAVVYLSYWCL
ncbi:hypothetical protein [Paenibacillus thiaminolyticus]|uniref:Uncharacterized protein n=1 Tax=Paenibacillus thiaminolyticus TaxID=49283 RepID=A0A3A3GDH9_PANTH|nr:hypothetical protein [Paenibacillus thiaminolyticus]RJG21318.1 hypothetical protein DQX05_21690 [Paenibacillus thiaminolyticus]